MTIADVSNDKVRIEKDQMTAVVEEDKYWVTNPEVGSVFRYGKIPGDQNTLIVVVLKEMILNTAKR